MEQILLTQIVIIQQKNCNIPNKKSQMEVKEVSWKRENRALDNDAESNVQLKKEINKQTDMDSNVQTSINDKIYDLKQEAVMLTKKFEAERYKNVQLQTIIKTIKLRMDDQRKNQASYVTDSNFQNIQTLERKIKKLQYDLEQINNKTNRVNSVISDKKHKISLLRTDRVIDSGIFRNIEKELHASEHEFKKLLIDKVRHQKIYQSFLNDYASLKAKAQQQFQNQGLQIKTQFTQQPSQIQESSISYSPQQINNNKFKQIDRNGNLIRNNAIQSEMRKQDKNCHFEFAVKKFLMNINLINSKQFVYKWHNIQNINQQYFQKLNSTVDQIGELQEEIKKLQKIITKNSIKFYKTKTQPTKHEIIFENCQKIQTQVDKVNDLSKKQAKLLKDFIGTQNLSSFMKIVGVQGEAAQNLEIQTLKDALKLIEEKMNQLNIYQSLRIPEESSVIQTGRTQRDKKQQKLEDVMNRMKFSEETDKIMKRQDFKLEYKRLLESGPTSSSKQNLLKKKTKKALP